MSLNLGLLIIVGVMAACGVYLLMERSLVRMLLGLLLCGNAINLLILVTSGTMGDPPILGRTSEASDGREADPLAQAMILTAIVITMGVAAFVLSLVYRLFVINRDDDDLEDDTEDVKILSGSLSDAPDRDRSDDPVTLADTTAGDFFDDDGNPLSQEEYVARHADVIETDLMPADADVIDELSEVDAAAESDEEDKADEAAPTDEAAKADKQPGTETEGGPR